MKKIIIIVRLWIHHASYKKKKYKVIFIVINIIITYNKNRKEYIQANLFMNYIIKVEVNTLKCLY